MFIAKHISYEDWNIPLALKARTLQPGDCLGPWPLRLKINYH
jgi:hypothetical protein